MSQAENPHSYTQQDAHDACGVQHCPAFILDPVAELELPLQLRFLSSHIKLGISTGIDI